MEEEIDLHIAINTLSVTPERGGVKTYLVSLLKALNAIETENKYHLFVSPLNQQLFEFAGRDWETVTIPLSVDNRPLRLFLEQTWLPLYLLKHHIDILFSPGNFTTFLVPCPQVVVLQSPLVLRDLRRRFAPDRVSRAQAAYYDAMLPLSAAYATKILAVSEDIKQRLLKQLPWCADKVVVIHEGVDAKSFSDNSLDESLVQPFPEPYILFVSTLFRYKNPDKLLRAFAILKHEQEIPHTLLIVGRDVDDQVVRLQQLAERLHIGSSVHFAGMIPHQQIAQVYNGADLLVFPSSVESFGLPLLEAMACGVPVIGSNRCSVPEVIGDAGLIVDPEDTGALAEAIYTVLEDSGLRKNLIQAGYRRAKNLSWERAAQRTLELFEKVSRA